MSDTASVATFVCAPRVEYRRLDAAAPLSPDLLAAVTFGASTATPRHNDPRVLCVGFAPLRGAGLTELWHANGPVHAGRAGEIRYAADHDHLFGVLEIEEREHGGIAGAAQAAYAMIRRFLPRSAQPHLLRVWNHLDAINEGEGDAERYRQFCVGRAAGLGDWLSEDYPAATAIGRRDGDRRLQVYWLSGRAPGVALENPRQLSPYRYPRSYGPAPPQFSRGMLLGDELVLISGTASIVGHASHHRGDLSAQLDESLANLYSVLEQAADSAPRIPARLGEKTLLKVYLRDASAVDSVEEQLRRRVPAPVPYLILAADICRGDLLVEVDCVHGI